MKNTELKQKLQSANMKIFKLREAQPEIDRLLKLEEEHNSVRNRLRLEFYPIYKVIFFNEEK